MALSPADERTFILPLFAGLQAADGWDTFLSRLLPRTGATRVCLLQRPNGAAPLHGFQREAQAERTAQAPLDFDALEKAGMVPLSSLRRDRVYALEEIADTRQAALKLALADQGIAHARVVRFAPGTEADAWVMLFHHRTDFTAADSALLSAMVPYLAVAITTLKQIMTLQLRAEVAEEALAMLGVRQSVLDRAGRSVVGEAIPARGGELAKACATVAGKPAATRAVLSWEAPVLLRPAPQFGPHMPKIAAATALVRQQASPGEARMARVVMERFGLSAREAALAVALACGKSLIEAGEQLRLTVETTRNYSKRIYAKTGAKGQADLVRMVLGDFAPFA